MAALGRLGRKNNIEFLSIVPKNVFIKVENSSNKNLNKKDNQVDFENDPLLVEGIKKYLIDFTFRAEFVDLLSFLRDLEYQDNVILLNDINLSLKSAKNENREIDESRNILEINMSITFYGKI